MELQLHSRTDHLPESVKTHVHEKLGKLDRYFRQVQGARVVYNAGRGMHTVEVTLEGDGAFLRSEERAGDPLAAVDGAVDKLERQVKRLKQRQRGGHRPSHVKEVVADHVLGLDTPDVPDAEEEPDLPRITRRKQFSVKPVSPDEAMEQMESLDHDFFLFHNAETGRPSLIYRRRDGNYGLIEPET